ncbi:redoxin domain-containing protein [Candidatus Berkiella aquae]|uniref:Thiol-disulfide oxidoreductase n=1 Tax=Candidatus Berkiella aquae TaxID=295108 RepID=A0A0Q9YYX9_9GAMM|nr:thioredoxin family protein [Candidatus Berkiella aquae]MCS5712586.1 thioredoxin family protein [Candidatus Berkiella aquae]
MALVQTPGVELGRKAPDFKLLGVDGLHYSLANCSKKNGLLVMFICNHCPYVKAILPRLIQDVQALEAQSIGCVAISSNDPTDYPEDSYENMQKIAKTMGFSFPYLFDESQAVAKAYGAVCTPDFFGYNTNLELQYRGRLDESGIKPAPADAKRELVEAMLMIAKTGKGPQNQLASQGCSIKWRF